MLYHNQGGYCNCLLLQARRSETLWVTHIKLKENFLMFSSVFTQISWASQRKHETWEVRSIVIAVVWSLWPSKGKPIKIEGTYERNKTCRNLLAPLKQFGEELRKPLLTLFYFIHLDPSSNVKRGGLTMITRLELILAGHSTFLLTESFLNFSNKHLLPHLNPF